MNIADLQLNFAAIAPATILAVTAILVMLVDAFSTRAKSTAPLAYLGIIGAAAAGLTAMVLSRATQSGFSNMVSHDAFAAFGEVIVCVAAIVTMLTAQRDMKNEGLPKGEYYVLLLAATSGMAFMMSASDLVVLFLGLELMSIPVYALVGFNRYNARSAEGAFKYFVLGAFATGFLLYGASMLYGATGSTNYAEIAARAADGALRNDVYFIAGSVLLLAAMAFKISAVPFHMWTPDVYQGAPVSITGYMSAGVKAAAFVALARILFTLFGSIPDLFFNLLWILSAVTMIVGNVLAVVQSNIKRMLAYSSIGHAGYLLLALTAGSPGATSAMLFYLLVYALANLGAFAVATALSGKDEASDIESYAGVATRHPFLAAAMALFMFSLAGIPPTGGFFGKFFMFKEAIERGLVNLAIVGMIASAIGVYYYLRVIVYLYMKPSTSGVETTSTDGALHFGLALTSLGIVVLGVMPNRLMEIAIRSVEGLFG
jgi:NADH-quinone oxidoreductase subunit N